MQDYSVPGVTVPQVMEYLCMPNRVKFGGLQGDRPPAIRTPARTVGHGWYAATPSQAGPLHNDKDILSAMLGTPSALMITQIAPENIKILLKIIGV